MTTPDEDIIQAAREIAETILDDYALGTEESACDIADEVARFGQSIRDAANKEAAEVIGPFGASHISESTDENGWMNEIGKERICDWFGPSAFRAARRWMQKNGGGDE